MERILASEIREKLKALLEGRREIEGGRLELVQLAARLIIEDALEGEARDVYYYVGEDNPVRVVDAFIGELDLPTLGFAGPGN